MYIFGKFDSLQRRLEKILNMFETIQVYSALEKSKIEGLEPMIGKYQVKLILKNCISFAFIIKAAVFINLLYFLDFLLYLLIKSSPVNQLPVKNQ